MAESKKITLEELEKMSVDEVGDYCFIHPFTPEYCYEACDLTVKGARIEWYEDFAERDITPDNHNGALEKISICKKDYVKVDVDIITDWLEDSDYNFNDDLMENLKGLDALKKAIEDFNKIQTHYLCDDEVFTVDLSADYYNWWYGEGGYEKV